MNSQTLKSWAMQEAQRCKITPRSVLCRIRSGTYPGLSLIKINQRVIYVDLASVPAGGFNLKPVGAVIKQGTVQDLATEMRKAAQ